MRSPKKEPFNLLRKRSKFKVTNWGEYHNILRNRGRIDFMIASDLRALLVVNFYRETKII